MTTDGKLSGNSGIGSLATYRILPERMPAIPPAQMSEQQRSAVAELEGGPRSIVKGPFLSMLRSPELMDRTQKLGAYIRFGSELDPRLRTVASLITIRFWTSQYEWAGHKRAALKAGLNPETIDAIAEGRRPEGMGLSQSACDFLRDDARHDIRAAPRLRGNNAYRPRRIVLSRRRACRRNDHHHAHRFKRIYGVTPCATLLHSAWACGRMRERPIIAASL